MASDALSDARAKLDHSRSHFHQLLGQGLEWSTSNAGGSPPVDKSYDESSGQYTWVMSESAALPAEWSLILGDFLGCARSTLDHLAWALATLDGQKPPKPTMLSFPIVVGPKPGVSAEKRWQTAVVNNLQNISPALYIPMIHRHQPFLRGSVATAHPLALLDKLCQVDKHRRLHLVQSRPLELQVDTRVQATNFIVQGQDFLPVATSEPGTIIARVWGRPTGNGDADVRIRFPPWTLAPIIEGEILMEGVCQLILAYLDALLSEFESVVV